MQIVFCISDTVSYTATYANQLLRFVKSYSRSHLAIQCKSLSEQTSGYINPTSITEQEPLFLYELHAFSSHMSEEDQCIAPVIKYKSHS
jgi:hypothetical protein